MEFRCPDEVQDWFVLFHPLSWFGAALAAADPDDRWDVGYIGRREVVLHFEEERLVRWDKSESDMEYVQPKYTGRYCKNERTRNQDIWDCTNINQTNNPEYDREIESGTGVSIDRSLSRNACEW